MKPFRLSFKALGVIGLTVGMTSATAMWMQPKLVSTPVDRLVRNLEEEAKANPSNGKIRFTLGRLHSMAYATGTNIWVITEDHQPHFAPWTSVKGGDEFTQPGHMTNDLVHLDRSILEYQASIRLSKNDALAYLGLGWVLEEAAKNAEALGKIRTKRSQKEWQKLALTSYRKAYELSVQRDLAEKLPDVVGDSRISKEAAQGIIQILNTKTARSVQEEQEIAELTKTIELIEQQGFAVTPIIFGMKSDTPYSQLINPDHFVDFDLDGRGSRSWMWVEPETAILVWDPFQSGQIKNGLQLFGSVTWWIFWNNGYSPLAALDDDHNGFLRRNELDGIAVWRDSNSNGISDPGEVQPWNTFGIESIAVTANRSKGSILGNPEGIRMKDGRSLPSYDWIAKSPPVLAKAEKVRLERSN